MGINTETKLPLHVKGKQVLQVIGKVVGEPWHLDTFATEGNSFGFPGHGGAEKKKPFDPSQPASRENCWHIRFEHSPRDMRIEMSPGGMSSGTMWFEDGTGHQHRWSWHPECMEEDGKLVTSGSHALGVAVARRLVRFFGGQAIYIDSTERIDYAVDNESARFPRKVGGQDSNDRWDQFQNALMAEPLLTSQELREAMGMAVESDKDYTALMDFLDARELETGMHREIPESPSPSPRHKPGGRL